MPRARARRRQGRRGDRRRDQAQAASTSRSCATARAACSGWSRWSRSRRPSGRVAYGPVTAKDVREPVRRRPAGGVACAVRRAARGDSLPQQADAADLRPLRHHRSAVAGRLSRAWRTDAAWSGRWSLGAGGDRRRGHQVRPARPRRRGLPDRHQVEDGRRHGGRPEIHRLQRRRGRLRHLRRPHDHGRRSLRADRGHGDRRHRGRRDQGLRLYPLGISARHPRHDERARVARWPSVLGVNVLGSPKPSTWKCASAPAPMSAARRPRCSKAWKASAAWCAPSRRCRRTRACSASRRSSTT